MTGLSLLIVVSHHLVTQALYPLVLLPPIDLLVLHVLQLFLHLLYLCHFVEDLLFLCIGLSHDVFLLFFRYLALRVQGLQ